MSVNNSELKLRGKEFKEWLVTPRYINPQIPNEIFEDFKQIESFQYRAYSYVYYHITNILYRNAMYGKRSIYDYEQKVIMSQVLSSIRRFTPYTKNGGILDKLGYITSERDHPIDTQPENETTGFVMYYDLDKIIRDQIDLKRQFKIRKPVKSFVRFKDDDPADYTGTYYNFSHTHSIEMDMFVKLMSDKNLDARHIYTLGYIEMKQLHFPDGVDIPKQNFVDDLGMTKSTVGDIIRVLRDKGYITYKNVKSPDRKGSTNRFKTLRKEPAKRFYDLEK